ncbi:MAG: hypothetical protein CL790_07115 [Chloroflexi bacterium]|nr:hypothetical protein [Chloroflexota bacterium]|tara:strand:+ start:34287 stop:35090 length:804 start_codon:yes stop_codon:yes gene_type:complete
MSSIPDASVLNQGEIDLFRDNGYLVKDGFLNNGLIDRLTDCLNEAIERRKAGFRSSMGANYIDGANSRIMHILNDDPAFLDMVDYPPALSIARNLMEGDVHFHASDAFWEEEVCPEALPRWHMDGREDGYRLFRPTVPLLQLKVGYYLSDMSDPDQGNLILVPQSHRREDEPPSEYLDGFDTFPGATQICGVAGTAIFFHNAVWHTKGPALRAGGRRLLLYYAYERPWMVGNEEHWQYPPEFYAGLTPERRKLFHGFVFDPPEDRPF